MKLLQVKPWETILRENRQQVLDAYAPFNYDDKTEVAYGHDA